MALDRLTKVDGSGISTISDYRVGIITASKFVGPFDGTAGNFSGVVTATNGVFSGNISAVDGNFSGNVTIGGTLTYEDVTNIDSVGLITARNGIKVLTGTATTALVVEGDGRITGILTVGTSSLKLDGPNNLVNVGTALTLGHTQGIQFHTQNLHAEGFLVNQINASGIITAATFKGDGDFVELDVDGHTNLDNISIAGVTTTTGNIHLNSGAKIGFATDSNTFIGQDDYDRLDFNVGGKRLASIVEGTNIPVLIIDKDGVNTARSNQSTNYNANPHGTELVLGNTSSNNHGLTIVSPSTNYGVIMFSDGSGGGLDSTRGSITFTHSDNKLILKSKIGSIALNHKDDEKLITTDAGISILKDLDVDGHTNLDNVSIAGVTTFTGAIDANSTLEVAGVANFDSTVQVAEKIEHLGDTDTYLQFDTNTINLHSGGTTGLSVLDASVRVPTKLGINGAAPQVPLDVISNGSGYAINVRGRSTDNIGEIRFTSNNYGALYGAIIGGPTYLKFASGGSGRWQIDSGGHFVPVSPGSYNIGSTSLEIGDIYLGVNKRVYCGLNQELELYTDGTNGYLKETNGDLYLQSTTDDIIIRAADNISIQAQGGEYGIDVNGNGSVNLYYDGGTHTTPKLKTSATGIDVHGEVAATQDYPNQRPALDFNFAQEKVLDPRLMFARDGDAAYYDEFGVVKFAGRNEPRFDHDPVTRESKGLLMEETRTNYFPYGTTPGDLWSSSKSGTFDEYTTETTAPDGTFTATKWTFTNNDPYLYHQMTLNANTSYTVSMWVKAGTNMAGDYVQIRIGGAPYSPNGDDITIPADGTWKRLSYTKTVGGSNETSVNVGFEPQVNPSGNPASGDVIYIWGAQIEVGHFMTSFIPTNGAIKTRYQDTMRMTGDDVSNIYNNTEGTMFYEASVTDITNDNQPIVAFRDQSNATGNEIAMGYRIGGGSSGNIRTWMRSYVTGSQVNSFLSNHSPTGLVGGKPYKHIFGFKKDDAADSYNTGVNSSQATDSSGNLPVADSIDELRFGAYYSSITTYALESGHIKRFSYWPVRLTNAQLNTYIA